MSRFCCSTNASAAKCGRARTALRRPPAGCALTVRRTPRPPGRPAPPRRGREPRGSPRGDPGRPAPRLPCTTAGPGQDNNRSEPPNPSPAWPPGRPAPPAALEGFDGSRRMTTGRACEQSDTERPRLSGARATRPHLASSARRATQDRPGQRRQRAKPSSASRPALHPRAGPRQTDAPLLGVRRPVMPPLGPSDADEPLAMALVPRLASSPAAPCVTKD